MAYAELAEVQALLPVRTWDSSDAEAEPASATVSAWLELDAAWIDLQMAGCAGFDPTVEPAASVVADVNAQLTAARVRDFKFPDADQQERYADTIRAEAKERLALLATTCGETIPDDGTDTGAFRSLKTDPLFTTGLQEHVDA